MRTTRWVVLAAGLALGGCDVEKVVDEAVGEAPARDGGRADAKTQLPQDPKDRTMLKGELAYGDVSWTPTDCVWADVQGRVGMIFVNDPAGYALAVWTSGVPEGESNVWFSDRANPPDDGNFQVGSKPCANARLTNDASEPRLTGGARFQCGAHSGEMRFRNCANALAGSASASVKWPPR